MKSDRVYLGTIKKCTNLFGYERYGDSRYSGDFRICSTEVGFMVSYADIVSEQALLIKVNEDKYIWVDSLACLDELFVNLGIPVKTLDTTPIVDNQLFVDKSTLEPFKINDKNVSVGKVRTLRYSVSK